MKHRRTSASQFSLLFFFSLFLPFFLFIALHPQKEKWDVCEARAISPEEERMFSRPVDMETDGSNIFVLDSQEAKISVFSFEGQWLRHISQYGPGPEELVHPTDMSLGEDEITVLDTAKQEVKFFSAAGQYRGGFKIGFRGYRVGCLNRDKFVVTRLPRMSVKRTPLLYYFNREGELIYQTEEVASSGDSAFDFFLFEHRLLLSNGKVGLWKNFGPELAIFFDEKGKRAETIFPPKDYPSLQFKLPLAKAGQKNIQAFFFGLTQAAGKFYLVCPGKQKDGDVGPSNRVAILNSQGEVADIITFPVNIYKLALIKSRFFIIDEENIWRLFDVWPRNDDQDGKK